MLTHVELTLRLEVNEEGMKPHERDFICDLAIDGCSAQRDFLRLMMDHAGRLVRDLMDRRRPVNEAAKECIEQADNSPGVFKYGEPNWPPHPDVERRPHKPVTRREAAKAIRAMQRVEAATRAAARKVRRAKAARR